jgi:ubiquinone/menaquinone biosynthesis C-methylase UbiE
MTDPAEAFTADSVRALWDRAADPYATGQAMGRDYYRYEFFGPAQADLCGHVSGSRLLDVGCGNGYFAREMARRGARVTGIDISPRMIEHARRIEREEALGIQYLVADAAHLSVEHFDGPFDVATSCVALQDMPDIGRVFRAVRSVLKPGGRFVASITHPWSDTPFRRWERDEFGAKRWLCVDRYFSEAPVTFVWERWGEKFTTQAYHATLETWIRWILDAGFEIRDLREPRPTEQAVGARPDLANASRVPYYVLFDLRCATRSPS